MSKVKNKFAGLKKIAYFFAAFVLAVVLTMCYNMSSSLALKAADSNEDVSYDLATFSNAATTYMNIAMSQDGGALVVSGNGHQMASFLGYQDPNTLSINSYGVGTPAAGNGLGYSYDSINGIATTDTKYRLLRYNGEVFHGQVTNGKVFSEAGGSKTTVGPDIISSYCKAGAYYAGIGVSDTGDDSSVSDSMRMLLGSVAIVVYVLAAAVNEFFGFCLSVAAAINPFRLFGGHVTISGGGVMQGIGVFLNTVADTINTYYSAFRQFGIGIVLPVTLAFGLFGWLLSDTWNKGTTAWQKMRGYIVKTFFIVTFIPLALGTYDEILVWLQGISDSGGVDGRTAIVSTFCDFEGWALNSNFKGFDDLVGDKASVGSSNNHITITVSADEIVKARSVCYKINENTYGPGSDLMQGTSVSDDAGGIGTIVASHTGNNVHTSDAVIHLLQRYARGDKVSSSKYATRYAPAAGGAKNIDYEEALLSSVWYRYDPQNPGILYHNDGKTQYTTAELDGMITGRFGKGWVAWSTSDANGYTPLAMYNYMNSVFSETGITVYSPTASSSDYVNHQHYSVSLVGTGFIKYVFFLDSLILLACVTILGYTYGVGIMFANFQAIFKLVGSVFAGMIGSMRAIATTFAIFFSLLLNIVISIGMFYMGYDILLRFYNGIGASVQLVVDSVMSRFGAGSGAYITFLITVIAQSAFMVIVTRKFLDWKKAVIVAVTEAVTGIINKFLGTNAAAPNLQMNGGLGETAAVLAAGAGVLAANGAFDGAFDGQSKLAGEQTTGESIGESIGAEDTSSGLNGEDLTEAEKNMHNDEMAAEDYVSANTDENGDLNMDDAGSEVGADGELGEDGALGENGELGEGEAGVPGEGETAEDAEGVDGLDGEGEGETDDSKLAGDDATTEDGAEAAGDEAVNPEDYETGYTDENGNFIPTDDEGNPLGFGADGKPLTAAQAAAMGIRPGGGRHGSANDAIARKLGAGAPQPRHRTVKNGQSGVEFSDGTFVPGRFDSDGNFHPGVTDSNGALHEGVLAEDGLHTGRMTDNGFEFDGNVDPSYAALGKSYSGSGASGSGANGLGADGTGVGGVGGTAFDANGNPIDAAGLGEAGFDANGNPIDAAGLGAGAGADALGGESGIPDKFNMPEGAVPTSLNGVDGIKYNNEFIPGTVGSDGSFTPADSSFARAMYDDGSGLNYAQMQEDAFNGSVVGDTIPMPDNAEMGFTTNGSDFYTPAEAANMPADQLQSAMRTTDADGTTSIQTGFASEDGSSFTRTNTGSTAGASAYGFGASAHAMPAGAELSAVDRMGNPMLGEGGKSVEASAASISRGNGQVAYTDASGAQHLGVANSNGTFEEGARYGVLTDSGFKTLSEATPADMADGTMGVMTAGGSFTEGAMGADGRFTASSNQMAAATGMAFTGSNESFNHSAAYMSPSEVSAEGYTAGYRSNGVSTLTAADGSTVDGVALSDGGAIEGANLMAVGDNGELVNYGAATDAQKANGAMMVMPNGDRVAGSVDSSTGAFTAYRSAESYNSGGNTVAIGNNAIGYSDGGTFEAASAGASLTETGGQAQMQIGGQMFDGVRNADGSFNIGGQAVVRTANGQMVPLSQASASQIRNGTTGVISGGKFTEGTFNAATSEFTPTMSQADISTITGDMSTAFSAAGNSQIISADTASAAGYSASYSATGSSVVTNAATGQQSAGVMLDTGEVVSGANLQVSDGHGGYINYGNATAEQRASGSTILRTANGDAVPVSGVNASTGAVSIGGPIPPSAVGGAYTVSAATASAGGYTQTYSASTGQSTIMSAGGVEVPGAIMDDGSAVVGANVVCADGNGGYVNYGNATAAQKANGTYLQMPNGATVAASDTGHGFAASAPISVGGMSNSVSAAGYGANSVSVSAPSRVVSGGASGNVDTYTLPNGTTVDGVMNSNGTISPGTEKVVFTDAGVMTRSEAAAAGVQNIESLPQGVRVGGAGGQVIAGTYSVSNGVEAFTPAAVTQNVSGGASSQIGRNVYSTPGYTAAASAGVATIAAATAAQSAASQQVISAPIHGAAGGFTTTGSYTAAAAANVASAGSVTMGGQFSSYDTYSVPGGGSVRGVYNANGTITKGAEKVVFTPAGVMSRSEAAAAGITHIDSLPQGVRVGGRNGQVIAGTYSMIDGDTEVFTPARANSNVTAAAMSAVGATAAANTVSGGGSTVVSGGSGRSVRSGGGVNARPTGGNTVQNVGGGATYSYASGGNGGGGSYTYGSSGGNTITMHNASSGAIASFMGSTAGGVVAGSFMQAPNAYVGTVNSASGAMRCYSGVGQAARTVNVGAVNGRIVQKAGASVDYVVQGNNSKVGGVYLADNSFVYNADKGYVDGSGSYITASQARSRHIDISTLRPAISYPSKGNPGQRCVTVGREVTLPSGGTAFVPNSAPGQYGGTVVSAQPLYTVSGGGTQQVSTKSAAKSSGSTVTKMERLASAVLAVNAAKRMVNGDIVGGAVTMMSADRLSGHAISGGLSDAVGSRRGSSGGGHSRIGQSNTSQMFADVERSFYMPGSTKKNKPRKNSKASMNGNNSSNQNGGNSARA